MDFVSTTHGQCGEVGTAYFLQDFHRRGGHECRKVGCLNLKLTESNT